MKSRKRLKFSNEIRLLMISLALICTVFAGFAAFNLARASIVDTIENDLKTENQLIIELLEHAVVDSSSDHLEDIVLDVEEYTHGLFVSVELGEITEAEAKMMLINYTEAIVVGETGYVYILNSEGKLISHPEFEGRVISDYSFVQEQVEMKNGYLEYEWSSLNSKKLEQKSLYMIYIEEWDYIISATVFRREIKHVVNVAKVEEKLENIKIYGNGFVVAVEKTGIVKIHPLLKNENISDEKDANGKNIKDIYT